MAQRAEEFAGALARLDRTCRFAIAGRLLELEIGVDFLSSGHEKVRQQIQYRPEDAPAELRRIAAAAEARQLVGNRRLFGMIRLPDI